MEYSLTDIIDIPETEKLLKNFHEAVGIPAAIIDLNGLVLVTSRWHRACVDFYRANEITERSCIESDTILANSLLEGKTYSLYRCQNGLIDAASPIIIEGRHLANFFVGQFLIEKPDMEFFTRQAREYGFDESAFVAAIEELPIVDKNTLPAILSFLTSFAVMIGSLGLKQLQQVQTERELRKAERDLKRAQEVAKVGNWRINVPQNVILWSDETYRIYGIPPERPVNYDEFLASVYPDDRQKVDEAWQAALGGNPYDIEHRIVVGDAIKWVHEQAQLECDSSGNLSGAFGTVQDITERKRMEEDLRRSRDELEVRVQERTAELSEAFRKLESMNQELEEFAYVASHDLQEPLRKIQTFGHLIRERFADGLNETGQDYLQRMEGAASRMQQLIQDLLRLSRIATRPEPLVEVDLNKVADEVAQVFDHCFKARGGAIEATHLPTIEADESQMRQLFQNLIGNAIKYQKEGEEPRIRVYGALEEPNTCRIFFEDNGIGFEDRYVEKIFKPFLRLHSQNSRFKGTGMGLAICRKIVERHEGSITAKSEPGKGSTFIIKLPVRHKAREGI